MKKLMSTAFIALFSIVSLSLITPALALSDGVVMVPTGDKEMAKAVKRARATLDVYWAAVENPKGRKSFAVKVKITDDNGSEHFWLNNVKKLGPQSFKGNIANVPAVVKKVKEGQLYAFKKNEISDWMFFQDQKIMGGFTIRVLADRMPKADGDRFKAVLAYEPK